MGKKIGDKIANKIAKITSGLVGMSQDEPEVPDIITFVEDDRYLGIKKTKTSPGLYILQKIALKAFYRGSRGNENTKLTEEEITYLKQNGFDKPENGDVISKFYSKEAKFFTDLLLIWGRRSGKDFIASIIALYEAMKLCETPGGDPNAYYQIERGAKFTILLVAASKEQANTAFNEISAKVMTSPYFKDKIGPEGKEAQKIWLLTPKDKEINKDFEARSISPDKGSICIEVGHSNPDTLVGKSCICVIMDEVASYRSGTGGPSTGDRIYDLLKPTVRTYIRETPKLDVNGNPIYKEDGEPEVEMEYHGKIISISSPRGKEGILYKLYETSHTNSTMLMIRAATWVVNTRHTEARLRAMEPTMSDEKFMMEYGAQFSGTAGETFFIRDKVIAAHHRQLSFRDIGVPGVVYFAHLDPAVNSHNYALCIVHKENFFNPELNKSDFRVVVDHIKFWSPTQDKPIDIAEVDDYLISLRRKFHFGLVTYDSFSESTIQKMKKHGLPAKKTTFNRIYKMKVYTELEELINNGRLIIPYHPYLQLEMFELQRRWEDRGFSVYPIRDGEGVGTDDICDALAGAIYNALSIEPMRFPTGALVNLPQAGDPSNYIVWRSMQGTPYGVGPGQQVARALERRDSWPARKRI